MTYLELVNEVLRRLREDEVTSFDQTTYSKMIGDVVNDAKRHVEDSWKWSALRTTIAVATVDGTSTYSLTGSNHLITILDATNDTSNCRLSERSQSWGRTEDLTTATTSGAPNSYVINAPDSNDDTQVKLYPEPDGPYNLTFSVVQRTEPFTADGDTLSVPSMPVIHLAFAMAAREKGEIGGNMAGELFGVAQRLLSDAIAYDTTYTPNEMIWYTP